MSTEAEQQAAIEWLRNYELFWQVRSRFYSLAFYAGESDPRAERIIPVHEELVSLNPVLARGLWDRAMREVGSTLTREMAIELSLLSSTARRAIVEASLQVLSLSSAESEALSPILAAEDDSLWLGVWDWFARERIAEGLTANV